MANTQLSKSCGPNRPCGFNSRPRHYTMSILPQWSAEMAYVVGMITTDGSLSIDGRHITITSTDIQLLETCLHCLHKTTRISPNPIGSLSKKPAFRIQIGDVILYRWLLKIGLFPRKSLTLKSLHIPDEYFPDFLRGHLDGDGSIIHYTDRYLTKNNPSYIYDRVFVYFLSGSNSHILWIRKKIEELRKIRGSLSPSKSKTQKGTSVMYRLKYSTKEAKILLNWMYYRSELPCLHRKFQIAKPYITLLSE